MTDVTSAARGYHSAFGKKPQQDGSQKQLRKPGIKFKSPAPGKKPAAAVSAINHFIIKEPTGGYEIHVAIVMNYGKVAIDNNLAAVGALNLHASGSHIQRYSMGVIS